MKSTTMPTLIASPRAIARCVAATAIGLCLWQSAGRAEAAGIGADSDILGIKLTMSRDEAKKIILDGFPGARIIELPVQFGTPEYTTSTTVGFVADITSASNQANNEREGQRANAEFAARNAASGVSPLNRTVANPGDYGRDMVVVLYDPKQSASGIFAVRRAKTFVKSEFLPPKALLDDFVQKYGQPARVNDNSITWTAPGVLQRTQRSRCYQDFGSGFLYEQVSEQIFNDRFAATMRSQVGDQFVRVLNDPKVFDRSQCGTILQLYLTISPDHVYATAMGETLIDLTRGYAELKAFADDFHAHADAAKQDQLQRASQNKPRL